jgi:acyl-CoA thioester hydrolase
MQVRVYFEDTDSGQIVYHANFLRFMERGRTNYLRLLGTNQHALLQEARNDAPGFTFVVRSMTIDFLKPAVLDDVLDVVTFPQEVRGASVTLLQECRRANDLLVTARVRVAFNVRKQARQDRNEFHASSLATGLSICHTSTSWLPTSAAADLMADSSSIQSD